MNSARARCVAFWLLPVLFVFVSLASPALGQKQPAKTHVIVISHFAYQPATLTVQAGDTVTWKNKDIVPHSVTANDTSFDSHKLAPGASWKFIAKKPGTFPYFCAYHPNMTATLVVR